MTAKARRQLEHIVVSEKSNYVLCTVVDCFAVAAIFQMSGDPIAQLLCKVTLYVVGNFFPDILAFDFNEIFAL